MKLDNYYKIESRIRQLPYDHDIWVHISRQCFLDGVRDNRAGRALNTRYGVTYFPKFNPDIIELMQKSYEQGYMIYEDAFNAFLHKIAKELKQ